MDTVILETTMHAPNANIAGASDDVDLVRIKRTYRFQGATLTIEGLPALRDNQSGEIYMPGSVAVALSDLVRQVQIAAEEQQKRDRREKVLRHFKPFIRLDASNLFPNPFMAT